jgi:hypothetical protein
MTDLTQKLESSLSFARQLNALKEQNRVLRSALKESRDILGKFGPAAFNILWCALIWNDHNFQEEVLRQKGKRAAELLGFERINGVDPVNAFIERFEKCMDSSDAALTNKVPA